MTVADVDEAIRFIADREKPLALYVFTESNATFNKVQKYTSSGGVCRNDILMQVSGKGSPNLWILIIIYLLTQFRILILEVLDTVVWEITTGSRPSRPSVITNLWWRQLLVWKP